jgi:hypothetical protein
MTDFEFTEQQNSIFLKLAKSMRGFGVASVIIGGTLIASGLALGAEGNETFLATARAVQGVAAILVGIIWWTSSTSFQIITKTSGNDIPHLMEAIKFLSTGFAFILAFALLRVCMQGAIAASTALAAIQ